MASLKVSEKKKTEIAARISVAQQFDIDLELNEIKSEMSASKSSKL